MSFHIFPKTIQNTELRLDRIITHISFYWDVSLLYSLYKFLCIWKRITASIFVYHGRNILHRQRFCSSWRWRFHSECLKKEAGNIMGLLFPKKRRRSSRLLQLSEVIISVEEQRGTVSSMDNVLRREAIESPQWKNETQRRVSEHLSHYRIRSPELTYSYLTLFNNSCIQEFSFFFKNSTFFI